MRYCDLIQFEPLESVKQLRTAGEASQAAEDVRTFVISKSMRDNLTKVVFPQLRFDNPDVDHKGLLLIATYGTGKTHLMSCLSAVAENADLAAELSDADTAAAAASVAGKFKVIRVEIGAVSMGLRDILVQELTSGLAAHGVEFSFPPLDQVTNNKIGLTEMMAAFEAIHPDQGLLLVIDELLDYLRTRRDTELILDLGFLREVGEICRDSRFRIIAGVQETLFDNPRFTLAQDEIRRVRERYQQFRISREDVAFVVQRRILGKTEEQKARIRGHLAQFSQAFESLGRDLDSYVEMFPVHPAYLRIFENLAIVEKRRVLTSLSEQIRHRLNSSVPDEEPGLICFDTYRSELESDPANKTIPAVKMVLDRTRTIRDRVEHGLAVKSDVTPALRVIDALAVHRLTTDDLEAPIGLTYDELRDDLCLLPPGIPELDPSFLSSSIETLVDEILRAVSGQFLSVNGLNGQVYLDLKKDVDYEQQIEERSTTLEPTDLDTAYYKALERLLEVSTDPFRSGYRIWNYELPWAEKRVTRSGYLFMGAPNERSTAQPPRDFYVYFLQPYAPPTFTDERKPDEVLLRLVDHDDEFERALRRYAAAQAKAAETTAQHKQHFTSRGDLHLQEMIAWLKVHSKTKLQVTHKGVTRPFGTWLPQTSGSLRDIKSQVDAVAAHVLAEHFHARYPGYPTFADPVTNANLGATISAALTMVATGRETRLGRMALSALDLLDVHNQPTDAGKYARNMMEALTLAEGKAVNSDTLFVSADGPNGIKTWGPWRLEREWAVVVAAVLAHLGRAELGFSHGAKIGAQDLSSLAQFSRDDLAQLAYVTPPAGTDTAILRQVAQLVGVAPGMITLPFAGEVVTELVTKAETMFAAAIRAKAYVQSTPRLWGEEIFDDPVGRLKKLTALADLLADVRVRNTPGKMGRFVAGSAKLTESAEGKTELTRVESLKEVADTLVNEFRYLENAGAVLGSGDPFAEDVENGKKALREMLRAVKVDKTAAGRVRRTAEELKARYKAFAIDRHTADRLDAAGDARKTELTGSDVWQDLRRMETIPLLPSGRFGELDTEIARLVTCKTFTGAMFDSSFVCAGCDYRPAPSSGPTVTARLTKVKADAPTLWRQWVAILRDFVAEESATKQIGLLNSEQQAEIAKLTAGRMSYGEISSALVAAISDLAKQFHVIEVTANGLWSDLFPTGAAMTPVDVAGAFNQWLAKIADSASDRSLIRIVPVQE
ncbi:DUF6079 family protein [Sphaerisporangium sp. NPDC004334]